MSNRVEQIKDAQKKAEGNILHATLRYTINAIGDAIPGCGGIVGSIVTACADREQRDFNVTISNALLTTSKDLENVSERLEKISPTPTAEICYSTLSLILDIPISANNKGQKFLVILNPATMPKLEPFIGKELIHLESIGSVMSLGTGCSIGEGCIEDHMNQYGIGNAFLLTIL